MIRERRPILAGFARGRRTVEIGNVHSNRQARSYTFYTKEIDHEQTEDIEQF
jgi:hypothetical protein